MSDWNPIKTAPKDGNSQVLLWDGKAIYLARWERKFKSIWNEAKETTSYRGAWTDDTIVSYAYEETFEIKTPTHWMPLPAPPISTVVARPCTEDRSKC